MVMVSDDRTQGLLADYTFKFTTTEAIGNLTNSITITIPDGFPNADFTGRSDTQDATLAVGSAAAMDRASDPGRSRSGCTYSVPVNVQISTGTMVTVVLTGLTNPAAATTGAWMVDTDFGSAAPQSATVTIADMGDGTDAPDPMMDMVDVSNASVTARPDDPGADTQITVKFKTKKFLAVSESITFEIGDDFGVPSTIDADDVDIRGLTAESDTDGPSRSPKSANPQSVIVDTNDPDERFTIELFIGNMDDSADQPEDLGLAGGSVTVIFQQGAGLTNRTEGGKDKWFVKTSAEDMLAEIASANVYLVPRTIDLSTYGDPRGEEVTVIGKGFKNGTTVKFWIDKDQDGAIDRNEVDPKDNEEELCDAVASGDDIAECTFTLSNPPFDPGKARNYINATDGRSQEATDTGGLPRIELEPSLSVSPNQGNPGDSINYQLRDFTPGYMVSRIQFARSMDICRNYPANPADARDARPTDDPDDSDGTPAESCPTGTVGSNGNLSFGFDIPNNIPSGSQDLRVYASNDGKFNRGDETDQNDNLTFGVGAGDLQLSSPNVLPNQRISVSGSGFTKSSNQDPAFIGDPGRADNSCVGTNKGSVVLGGDTVPWGRINDDDGIEVTSGGTWSATIDLPVNSATVVAGTRELRIRDCQGGEATVDLIFAERVVTMTPEEGGAGSEVVITGKNFPVSNDDSNSDVEVTVEYDATIGKDDDDDVEPDALGNFTVILEVPEDVGIPSDNTVKVSFKEDDKSEVLDTFTHRVPQGTVSFNASRGGEGSNLTIEAKGFARFTNVDLIEFDNRDITPSPKPGTDTNGNGSFNIRIPGADPGIYIIRVEIDEVVATSTFTVVSGSGVSDGAVETVLGNVISADALDRVFRFDNTTKMWEWYISDPAFTSTNNLGGLSSGDLVYIKVTKDVSADILGASTTLTCTNAGTDTEDCWNLVAIP